jgi:hypothetical protein
MIDRDKTRARLLVAQLHDTGQRTADTALRTMLEDAAVLLDEYQAGLTLATPHPLTGMAVVHSQACVQIDMDHIDITEEIPA